MKNNVKRSAALLISLSMLVTALPMQVLADEQKTEGNANPYASYEQIAIASADDLVDLAENCLLGSYSEKIYVTLTKNIDLSEVEDFTGFASFSGVFDGDSHWVTGVTIESGNGAVGFFGYVEQGAVIRDLTVEGTIYSDDSSNYVGVLAGVNAGTITGCVSKGIATGTGATAGIVGLNGGAGLVENCRNEADVSALDSVGGICGENRGTITGCKNEGGVNNESDWLALEDDTVMSLTLEGIYSYLEETAETGSDIGGIAGWSIGTISGCTNLGTVGYQHAGLNVGGIVGRMTGTLTDCMNYGYVYGKQDIGGIVGQLEPTLLAEGESLQESMESLNRSTEQLNTDVNAASKAAQNQLDAAAETTANLSDTAAVKSEASAKASEASETLSGLVGQAREEGLDDVSTDYEDAAAALDSASEQLAGISDDLAKYSDAVSADIQAINDQISDINALTNQKRDNIERILEGGDVIEDYSALRPDREDASRVKSCTNLSPVNGDTNVGGIVGSIALESMEDTNTEEEGNTYYTCAVLENCKDAGTISVRKQNGGGIVGYAALGLVRNCQSSSRVIADDANYIGGIAGYMDGTLTDSYTAAVVNGASYVGGVAGAGSKVRNTYSMTAVLDYEKWAGAIMGDVVSDSDEDITVAHARMMENVYNNYFVGDALQGINNISYNGIAQAITYKELTEQNLSNVFTNLKVTYLDEDYKTVKVKQVAYGDSLTDLTFPQIASGDSEYTDWEGLYSTKVEGNVVLIASSVDEVSVLKSDLEIDGKPVILVSGNFFETSLLEVTGDPSAAALYVGENKQSTVYSVSLKNTDITDADTQEIRFYNSLGNEMAVYQLTGENWEKCKLKTMGSYEETSFTGSSATFCVVESTQPKLNLWQKFLSLFQ